jgi:hypothetical protein
MLQMIAVVTLAMIALFVSAMLLAYLITRAFIAPAAVDLDRQLRSQERQSIELLALTGPSYATLNGVL